MDLLRLSRHVPAVFAILLNLEDAVVASKVFDLKSSIDIEPSFTDFAMSMTLESTFLNWEAILFMSEPFPNS